MTKADKQKRGGELLASALVNQWRKGIEEQRKEAEALRKCTGSVAVTVREERREADGTLTVVAEDTSHADPIAAAATEIMDLWWTRPEQGGYTKYLVVEEIIRRHLEAKR